MYSLTVWARHDALPTPAETAVLWDSFLPADAPQTWISLPTVVQSRRVELRESYHGWLYQVGRSRTGGGSLARRMQIRPGLSYWWLTLPAEFSLEPGSCVYLMMRLMTLDHLATELGATVIHVEAHDRRLARLIRRWAEESGRSCSTRVIARPASSGGIGRRLRIGLYECIPTLGAIRVLAGHLAISGRRSQQQALPPGIVVVDYLAHLGPRAGIDGVYDSNYWGPLVSVLEAGPSSVTWMHLGAKLATRASVGRDRSTIAGFANVPQRSQHHLLHDRLSLTLLTRSCRDYLRILWWGLTTPDRVFNESGLRLPASAALRRVLRKQFRGRDAMLNAIWINLFEKAVRDLGHQRLGIYLMENQPWEMAFISAWRRAGNGPLLGVVHSTARFWDTRLLNKSKVGWGDEAGACRPEGMPTPTAVVVNGPAMRESMLAGGYPRQQLVAAEALRFRQLTAGGHRRAHAGQPRILVLGEYSDGVTQRVVSEARRMAEGSGAVLWFRPHPTADQLEYSGLVLDQERTIHEALRACDAVICGATSGAALDAAMAGLPTLLVADPAVLQSSPAEGLAGVRYASTPEDLRIALAATPPSPAQDSPLLFDADLMAWKALIARFSTR